MIVHTLLTLLILIVLFTPSGVSGVYASTAIQQSYPADFERSALSSDKNPDLIISEITLSPENPALGERVTFAITVENVGDAAAAPSKLDCYIDNNRVSSELINSLESGAKLTASISWKAQPGDHIIRAVADSGQNIAESSETDNELTLAFSVVAPNLVISNITWLPEKPSMQDNVTFTVTVKNSGTRTAGNSHLDFYIDGVSRSYREIPRLEAGATSTVAFSWTAPDGSHEIKAVADVLSQVTESDESDNSKTVICATLAPDLVIQKVTLSPAYPLSGDNVTFTVTIGNTGLGKSSASHVAYYNSGNIIASSYVSPMGAGTTTQKSFSWIAETGTRAITVVADSDQENAESDETNNTKVIDVPEGPPDLFVENIEWSPSSPYSGQAVTFNITVKNQGHAAAALSVLHFYIDSSRYSALVNGISTDNNTMVSFSWTAQEGSHMLTAIADAENYFTEENESNNVKTATITPSPPVPSDLIVQKIVWFPENPVVGDAVTFTATLNNRGSGQAERSSVAFYVDGLHIAASFVSPLNAGAATTATLSWDAMPGMHTIRAIADSNQVITESNENNNTYTAKVAVSASDLAISEISWEPLNPSPGDMVTFTLHITNRGNYKANHAMMGYFISGSPLGNHYIEELESGSTVTKTFTMVAPAGTWAFKAVADMNQEVSELDENNNDKTITLPAPDLAVEAVNWSPDNPATGGTGICNVTVNNRGGDAAGDFSVIIYIDEAQQACIIVDDLKAGAVVTKSFTLTVPGGSHIIKTTVDEADNIMESDETNNEKTLAVSAPGLPAIAPAVPLTPPPAPFSTQAPASQEPGSYDSEAKIISPALPALVAKPAPVIPAEDEPRFDWRLIGVVGGSLIIGAVVILVLVKSKPRRPPKLVASKSETNPAKG